MVRRHLRIGLCFVLPALGACGGSDHSAQNPGFQPAQQPPSGPYAQQQPGQPGATQAKQAGEQSPSQGQQPGQVAPLGAIMSDPSALQNIIAGALSGTSASLAALTGGEQALLEQGIRMSASTLAKAMKPEGQMLSAKLSPGGHAEATVALRPGSCYTVIGFGAPGIFQYQINLITAPPLPPQVLAQSDADGNDPAVGPNEQCLKNPYPLPMQLKVDMHVVKGQGLVGAQLYRK
jgi:hypothetical protein